MLCRCSRVCMPPITYGLILSDHNRKLIVPNVSLMWTITTTHIFAITGNIKSLREIPQQNGTDVYSLLHKHRQQTYSSHRMTLALHSKGECCYCSRNVFLAFQFPVSNSSFWGTQHSTKSAALISRLIEISQVKYDKSFELLVWSSKLTFRIRDMVPASV